MRQRRRQSLKEVLKSVLRVEQELHFTLPYVFAESALPAANSASCYGCFEDVLVEPVVIAELELSHVQRQILTALNGFDESTVGRKYVNEIGMLLKQLSPDDVILLDTPRLATQLLVCRPFFRLNNKPLSFY